MLLPHSAPCHTRGSMLFHIDGPTPCFFGGDTLFCGGCGAAFEGSQAEMSANFVKIWRTFPPHTLVFPGHEYSLTILPGYLNGTAPWPDSPIVYSKAPYPIGQSAFLNRFLLGCLFAQICSLIWRAQLFRMASPPVPTVPLLLADELLINTNFAELRSAVKTLCAHMELVGCGAGRSGTLFLTRVPGGCRISAWRMFEDSYNTELLLSEEALLNDQLEDKQRPSGEPCASPPDAANVLQMRKVERREFMERRG